MDLLFATHNIALLHFPIFAKAHRKKLLGYAEETETVSTI